MTGLPTPRVWTAVPGDLDPNLASQPTLQPALQTAALPTMTPIPLPSATPTMQPTPLPSEVNLKGVRYEDQHGRFNYCAPANLAMALSYWDWEGNRDVVGPVLKPDPKDKNVMPYELVDYVNDNTQLRALERVAGDLETLKRFIAAGYPVLVEKAAYFHDLSGVNSWMGHYQVVTGYDDADREFVAQDSFVSPDISVSYDTMETNWRGFNDTYIIIYPPEKEAEVLALLGQDADETSNFQRAAQKASDEIYSLSGIDQYYAWFNRGTNLMHLQDYAGAAEAYDQAFSVYPSIPEAARPWRMLWYQTGPYFAYFHSGRYWDVLNLAETTLSTLQSEKNLEESFYWRGMAKAALGDTSGAIEDFRLALKYHQGFEPALYQLERLGAEP
jgi:tetratricopeptide (TPR) repeat protein